MTDCSDCRHTRASRRSKANHGRRPSQIIIDRARREGSIQTIRPFTRENGDNLGSTKPRGQRKKNEKNERSKTKQAQKEKSNGEATFKVNHHISRGLAEPKIFLRLPLFLPLRPKLLGHVCPVVSHKNTSKTELFRYFFRCIFYRNDASKIVRTGSGNPSIAKSVGRRSSGTCLSWRCSGTLGTGEKNGLKL